jgi:hypothetical protein
MHPWCKLLNGDTFYMGFSSYARSKSFNEFL